MSAQASSPSLAVPALSPVYDRLAPLAEPLLRITAGLFLVPHGSQKLFGWFGGYGIEATGQFFASKLGLPAGLALMAGIIEFFGGLLLAAGLLTRPAAALVVGLMTVAAVQVHWAAGFFWTAGGVEYPLLWGVVALFFMLRGGGRYSLDHLFGKEI